MGAGPKPFWRGPANGGILPWPPRLCPGSWPAWAQAMRFLMWAGLGRCPGACLPPFQSSTPLLEPSGSFGSLRKRPGYPLGSRPMHHRGFQGLALARLVGGTVLDSVYKPVYPSIYMLYRMYICWEHARFCVSLLCVVCSTAQSPKLALAGEGATVMPLPHATTVTAATTTASPHLSVCVLSSVHASIGLMQPPLSLQLPVHMTVKW